MDFQRCSYFAMRLDSMDNIYLNPGDEEQGHHQADITLKEKYRPTDTTPFDNFERFDVEGDSYDEETEFDFIPPDDDVWEQHNGEQFKQQSAESKEANSDQEKQRKAERVTKENKKITIVHCDVLQMELLILSHQNQKECISHI